MPKPFDRIYLDSNILIAQNWPEPSMSLRNLLLLATQLQIEIYLPAPVEQEVEEHWLRVLAAHRKRLVDQAEKLRLHTRAVLAVAPTVHATESGEALTAYRIRVKVLKDVFQLGSTLFTSRSLEEIFRMATRLVPPFQEKGRGFQDAVIFLSVVDHLKLSPSCTGILISEDKDFVNSRDQLLEFARSQNVRLEIHRTLGEVQKPLLAMLADQEFNLWKSQNDQAAELLETRRFEIQEFIARAVVGAEAAVTLAQGHSVERVELLKIEQVVVDIQTRHEGTKKVGFVADVKLEYNETASTPPPESISEDALGFRIWLALMGLPPRRSSLWIGAEIDLESRSLKLTSIGKANE